MQNVHGARRERDGGRILDGLKVRYEVRVKDVLYILLGFKKSVILHSNDVILRRFHQNV